MEKYLSKYFQIISAKPESVEIKSMCHYWRIIEKDGVYFLHHKYSEDEPYHVQSHTPFASLSSIRKYIVSHDNYIASTK